jgi:hypothetical protein
MAFEETAHADSDQHLQIVSRHIIESRGTRKNVNVYDMGARNQGIEDCSM